jgi:hypothetical protein
MDGQELRRTQSLPSSRLAARRYQLLDLLAAVGVVDRHADRREVQWDLNERGKDVVGRVGAQVSPSDLERVSAWIVRQHF